MAVVNLTEARIRELTLNSGIWRDEQVKGLMVVCHATTKTFAVQGDVRRNGRHVRTVQVKIDRADRIGLREARNRAKAIMSQIQSGVDPTAGPEETAGEAAAAFEKAEELVAKYKLDSDLFRWPPRPSTLFGSARSGPGVSKQPPATAPGRRRGIGKLAERLIVEHPDWTYAAIAAEVSRLVEGAKASEKSVRWYASKMRRRGEEAPSRRGKRA